MARLTRERLSRGLFILPTLFTVGNLFCGYLSVWCSIRGTFETAAILNQATERSHLLRLHQLRLRRLELAVALLEQHVGGFPAKLLHVLFCLAGGAGHEVAVPGLAPEQLGVDEAQVDPTASFVDDLGADSLDTVELVMAFEEAFNIEIPDEAAEKIQKVKDAVEYIEKNSPQN